MEPRSNYPHVMITAVQSSCNTMPTSANQERDPASKECIDNQQLLASKSTCKDNRETKVCRNLPTISHTRKTKVMEQSYMLVDKNSGSFLTQLNGKFDLNASKKSKSDFKKSGENFSDFNTNYSSTNSLDHHEHNGSEFSSKNTQYSYNETEEEDSSKVGLPVVYFGSQQDILDLYQGTAQKPTKTRLSSSSCSIQNDQNMPEVRHHSESSIQQDSDLDKTPEELFPFYEDDDSSESLTDFADELFDFITNPDAGSSASWSETPFHDRPLLSDDDFLQRSVQVTDLDALLMQQNAQDSLPYEQNCENEHSFANENENDRMDEKNAGNKVVTQYNETELNFDYDEYEEVVPQRMLEIADEEKIPLNDNIDSFQQNKSEGKEEQVDLEIDSIKLNSTSCLTERTSNMEQTCEEEIIALESPRDHHVNITDLFIQNSPHGDQTVRTLEHKTHESFQYHLAQENVTNSQERNVKTADLKDIWNFLGSNNSDTTVGPSEVNQPSDEKSNNSNDQTTKLISLEKSDNFDDLFDENANLSHTNNCGKFDDDRQDVCLQEDIYIKDDHKRVEVPCTVERECEGGGIGGICNRNVVCNCSGDGVLVDGVNNGVVIDSGVVSDGGGGGFIGVGVDSDGVGDGGGGFIGVSVHSDGVSDAVGDGSGGFRINDHFDKTGNTEENRNDCQSTPSLDSNDLCKGTSDVVDNAVIKDTKCEDDFRTVTSSSCVNGDKCESGQFDISNGDYNGPVDGSVLNSSTICSDDINGQDDSDSTDVIVYPEIIVHALEMPYTEVKVQYSDGVNVKQMSGSDDQELNKLKFHETDRVVVSQMENVKEKEMHIIGVQEKRSVDVQGKCGIEVQEITSISNQQTNVAKFQETNDVNIQKLGDVKVNETTIVHEKMNVQEVANDANVQQTNDVTSPKEHYHTSNNRPNQTCKDLSGDEGHLMQIYRSNDIFDSENTESDHTINIGIKEAKKQNSDDLSHSSVPEVSEELQHNSKESDFTIVNTNQSQFTTLEVQRTNDGSNSIVNVKSTNAQQPVSHSVNAIESSEQQRSKKKQSKNRNADDVCDDVNHKRKFTHEHSVDKSKNVAPSKSLTASGSDIIITVDIADDDVDDKSTTVKSDTHGNATKLKTTSNSKSKPAKVTRISSSISSSARASSSEKTSRPSRKSRGSDSEHLRNLKSTKLTEKTLKKHSRHLRNAEKQISSEQPLGEAPESPRWSQSELSLDERILNVNRSIDWVRKVIMEMRAQDFTLKLQFDGLRQEIRTLKQEFEQFGVNCECYDDEELKKLESIQKKPNGLKTHVNTNTAIKEDSGYHSDASSVSDTKDDGKTKVTSVTTAKFLYEPVPSFPKVQTLNSSSKCVFEIVL